MVSLLTICTCWLGGLLAGGLLEPGASRPWFGALALSAATWVLGRRTDRGGAPLPAWILATAALLAGFAAAPHTGVSSPPGLRRGLAVVEGHVEQVRHGRDGARSTLVVESGHYLGSHGTLPPGVRVSVGPHPLPGSARVQLLVRLHPVTPMRNPSPHPPWPRADRIDAIGKTASAGAIEVRHQPVLARLRDSVRQRVRDALNAGLAPKHAGLARALVLGEGAAVQDVDRDVIRRAGLSHVLAVSGLHVAIFAGLLVALLRQLLVRLSPVATRFEARRLACALGVPLALALASFAGASPSALRAGATAALGWCVIAMGRRPAPGSVAAGAVMLVTAADPSLALRPGMLLSVAATAAILTAGWDGVSGSLQSLVTLSTRTLIATAPLVLWCFGSVALPGVVANVVLLPVASLLLIPMAAAHALCATALPIAAATTAALFTGSADAFVGACGLFARFDAGAWPPPNLAQGIASCGLSAAILLLRGVRMRLFAAAAAAIVIGAAELHLIDVEQPTDRLRVTFVDVGQGDAALVDLPDGRLMLVDAGGALGGGPDPGERALLPLLRARRRNRIDIAVLSHPHPDHYGGLAALLREVPIGELWDSGQAEHETSLSATSAQAAQLLREARARGTVVRGPRELCGHPRTAGGAVLRVLWPCPGYDSGLDPNDNSLVVRVDFGQRRFLFAGDIEGEAEARLVGQPGELAADVLKVAHHGSRTSSSDAFVRAASPQLAVISAGAHNRFGHPHRPVHERLERRGAHVVQLAVHGGTTVTTDGSTLQAESWSGARWNAPDAMR